MTHIFFKKAQQQPDLVDFCEYIKRPVSILEDIQDRYKDIILSKKPTQLI